jgi:hypothetical protein
MIRMKFKPADGKNGRVVLVQTSRISDVLHQIRSLGYLPTHHHELSKRDAVDTPEILVAIGSTVAHPERKHTHVPAYVGYKRNGEKVHVLAGEGSLNANVEVAIKAA